jgi:hypothetical protein
MFLVYFSNLACFKFNKRLKYVTYPTLNIAIISSVRNSILIKNGENNVLITTKCGFFYLKKSSATKVEYKAVLFSSHHFDTFQMKYVRNTSYKIKKSKPI